MRIEGKGGSNKPGGIPFSRSNTNGIQKTGTLVPRSNIHFSPVASAVKTDFYSLEIIYIPPEVRSPLYT